MTKFKINEGKPIFSWCSDIESSALDQIANLSELPFIHHHVAIMPDCHSGYGMPIGGVIATEGVIIPNAVGVDIGCGMCAIKTDRKTDDLTQDDIKEMFGGNEDTQGIRDVIPVGFEHNKEPNIDAMPPAKKDYVTLFFPCVVSREYISATHQLGSLGGGNHFIELQKDTENNLWIMIHSGSRNLGKKVCDYYNGIAKELNRKYFSTVNPSADLAFLPLDSDEGLFYLEEMTYCVEFALANRKLMMSRILDVLDNYGISADMNEMINIAHNYATMENHYGKNVMVHRKGATLARKGTIGIIPGSQGTSSFIVEGLGNPESFCSCSHGAGRRMSRTKAIAELNLEKEIEKMDGIVHGIRNSKDLDEASGAYKDINDVMEQQADLVKILVELKPMGVIKG